MYPIYLFMKKKYKTAYIKKLLICKYIILMDSTKINFLDILSSCP